MVVGLTTETLKKPNPATVLALVTELKLETDQILYVGDSGIDMQTALRANLFPVGVTWGYRPADELLSHGAKEIVSKPAAILKLL